jgi:hypothetical protein
MLLLGCARGPGAEEGGDKGEVKPAAVQSEAASAPQALGNVQLDKGETKPAAAQSEAASALQALGDMQIDVPSEWVKKREGRWAVFASPDGVSRVAMGAIAPGDSTTKKLQEAGAAIGATEVRTMAEQDTRIGPSQLDARAADGACTLGAGEGRIGYVVADVGGDKRVMVVHVAPKDASDESLAAGRMMVASLRRR